jgi:hypothetical protein
MFSILICEASLFGHLMCFSPSCCTWLTSSCGNLFTLVLGILTSPWHLHLLYKLKEFIFNYQPLVTRKVWVLLLCALVKEPLTFSVAFGIIIWLSLLFRWPSLCVVYIVYLYEEVKPWLLETNLCLAYVCEVANYKESKFVFIIVVSLKAVVCFGSGSLFIVRPIGICVPISS